MTLAATILLAVLVAATTWLEVRRPDRRHLLLRIIAAVVSAIALTLVLAPPYVAGTRRSEVALLVTEGASAAEVRRIADSVQPAHTLRLGDSLQDLRTLGRRHPGLREVVVAGWGLDSVELRNLRGLTIGFVPSALPDGPRELSWPREVALGEDVLVEGVAGRSARVRLDAGRGLADSVVADSVGRFVLRTRPRAAGLGRFTILANGRSDTIPVWVREARPPALLVIRSSPSFESSRLRDWLAARGGSILVQSDVSVGRARVDQVNSIRASLRPITASLLDSFDVIWIDGRTLGRLARTEAAALRAAVDSGLGLLLEPDDLAAARRLFGQPFPALVRGAAARPARLRWEDGAVAAQLPIAGGEIGSTFATRTLAADDGGRPVVTWSPLGAGGVVTSLVTRPSRWLLEGERAAYDAYWSRLLAAAQRPRPRWELVGAAHPVPHEPIVLRRAATEPAPVIVRSPSGKHDTVYAEPAGPGRIEGRYWPREAGAHLLAGAGDSLGFEVAPPGAWQTLRAAGRDAATRRAIATQGAGGSPAPLVAVESQVPRGWFVPLLLLGLTCLWWERRTI